MFEIPEIMALPRQHNFRAKLYIKCEIIYYVIKESASWHILIPLW